MVWAKEPFMRLDAEGNVIERDGVLQEKSPNQTKDNINVVIGERTALIRTDKKLILLEIVWQKKHWWSLRRPVIEAQYDRE